MPTRARPENGTPVLPAQRPAPAVPDALELCRTLAATLPDSAVFVFDLDLRHLLCEGPALWASGRAPLVLEGRLLSEIVPAGSLAKIEALYRRALGGEHVDTQMTSPHTARIVRVRLRPVLDAHGQVVAGLLVADDVSGEPVHEQTRWERLFDSAPVGILLAEPGGSVLEVNDALCALLERSRQSLVGTPYDALWPSGAGEVAVVTGSGQRWVSVTTSTVEELGRTLLVSHVVDVTETTSSRARLDEAQQVSRTGSWEWEVRSGEVHWSTGMELLAGLEPGSFDGRLSSFVAAVHPDDHAVVGLSWARVSAGQLVQEQVRYRFVRPDGQVRTLETRVQAHHGATGALHRVTGTATDVSEQVAVELELREAHAFQDAVLATSPDIIALHDATSERTLWASRGLATLLGYSDEDIERLQGRMAEHVVPDADRQALADARSAVRHVADGETVTVRHRARHRDGRVRWLLRNLTPFHRDEHGALTQYLTITRDITEMVEAQDQLEHAALHDPLTGLPNRRLIADRLQHAVAQRDRTHPVAVLFLDLDGFKPINDAYGHAAGDEVLMTVADRLRHSLRPFDTVGRMGGDEFVALVEGNPDEDVEVLAVATAERLRRAVCEPILLRGVLHSVTASTGLAYARPGDDAEVVLQEADAAMYRAKQAGKDRLAVYSR